MHYALQSLLDIRLMREDKASGELTAARQSVRTAEAALEDRRREQAEFERTREERRDRIYDTIMGRSVSRDQIDLAQEGVARIDEEGALRADNVLRAEDELKKKVEEAETARTAFVAASKNRMKIDEHRAVWLTEQAREEEHRVEGELEDFTGRKQNLDD